jgi:hypothetical protein
MGVVVPVGPVVNHSGPQPGVRDTIVQDKRKHLTYIKTKHRNRLNLEPALILTLMKIRPRIEVLACQNLINRSEPH